MTTREARIDLPLDRAANRIPVPASMGLRRWLAKRGWIHAVLLIGMAACLYPLLWMFLTSVKTDEELTRDEILPAIPVFRSRSPYVRNDADVVRPYDVDAPRFLTLLPSLRELTTAIALSSLPSEIPPSIDAGRWASSAASLLLSRTLAQMPRQVWRESADVVTDRYRSLLTPEAVATAASDQLSRVELLALTLGSLDGRLFRLASASTTPPSADVPPRLTTPPSADVPSPRSTTPPSVDVPSGDVAGWHVASRAASLVAVGNAARLDYHFGSGSDPPIVLAYDFDLPPDIEASDVHKIVLAIRADDSWHGVDAVLDVGGVRWKSARTTYLVQNREQSISFQPPTFDDTTVRVRTWVPLRADGPSERVRNARLSLMISPSSQFHAIVAKAERNYVRAFDSVPLLQYVGNSLLLVTLTIGGAVFSSAFVAYAFARLAWPGRSLSLVLLLSTMMVPPQVTMIPSFLIWRGLGWYNTLNPLWIPAWFGNAFFIFLMVQYMKTIPRELEEAARIDGLGVVQTWWYIIVPQLKPTLAAIAVMSFLGSWNEFMGPLIYLRDQSKFPLSLGLFGMRIDHGADWSMLMAANVLMTVPSVIVFFRFQRYLVQGIAVTGMKG